VLLFRSDRLVIMTARGRIVGWTCGVLLTSACLLVGYAYGLRSRSFRDTLGARETHVTTEAPPAHVISQPQKASERDTRPSELTRRSHVPVARANPALAALAENAITALEALVATRKNHLSLLSSQCNSAMNQYLSAVDLQLFMAPKQVTPFLVIDTDPALKKVHSDHMNEQAPALLSNYERGRKSASDALVQLEGDSVRLLGLRIKLLEFQQPERNEQDQNTIEDEGLKLKVGCYRELLASIEDGREGLLAQIRKSLRLSNDPQLASLSNKSLDTLQDCDAVAKAVEPTGNDLSRLSLRLLRDYRSVLQKAVDWQQEVTNASQRMK
jgi:hypothetical protein